MKLTDANLKTESVRCPIAAYFDSIVIAVGRVMRRIYLGRTNANDSIDLEYACAVTTSLLRSQWRIGSLRFYTRKSPATISSS